jgi:SAM-dependent methyltransferase
MGAATSGKPREDQAERAYDAMASVYDDVTAHHDYETWLANLLGVLEQNGLRGDRLLDVGCGTGKSFLPMLPRGWQITGCDISRSMLRLARRKVDDAVHLEAADMRALPRLGEFDLVWALDDAINYLLNTEELGQALSGMRANLAPTGLLLFDVNTLREYRTSFAETEMIETDGHRLVWRGDAASDVPAGSICEARIELDPDGSGEATDTCPEISIHRQRHFSEREILAALHRVRLETLDVYGHGTDGVPQQPLDELTHSKAIYIARRA